MKVSKSIRHTTPPMDFRQTFLYFFYHILSLNRRRCDVIFVAVKCQLRSSYSVKKKTWSELTLLLQLGKKKRETLAKHVHGSPPSASHLYTQTRWRPVQENARPCDNANRLQFGCSEVTWVVKGCCGGFVTAEKMATCFSFSGKIQQRCNWITNKKNPLKMKGKYILYKFWL